MYEWNVLVSLSKPFLWAFLPDRVVGVHTFYVCGKKIESYLSDRLVLFICKSSRNLWTSSLPLLSPETLSWLSKLNFLLKCTLLYFVQMDDYPPHKRIAKYPYLEIETSLVGKRKTIAVCRPDNKQNRYKPVKNVNMRSFALE